ncbi:MAG: dephospho-CoA kinase [Acidobacteriota bacterium]
MRRLALTGGIATGKSYVAHRLTAEGVPVVDADALARAAVAPGSPALAAIVDRFGEEMLSADGSLDRGRLARLVFTDATARADLESLIHPEVRRGIDHFFRGLPAATPFAVADIPLLFETGRATDFDAIIVAACSPETQLARLMARDKLSIAEATSRIAAQLPIEQKRQRADHVIDTEGSWAETDARVEELLRRLRSDP